MPAAIHYNGRLDNRARLADLLDAARLYCAEQRWMYRDIEEVIVGHAERVAAENGDGEAGETVRLPIDETLEGILVTAHIKADPLWLTFNREGYIASYMPLNEPDEYWERTALLVDTQAAGIATHVGICEFLQYLRVNYMPGLNVYDETNYFESGDVVNAERALRDSSSSNTFDDAADALDTVADAAGAAQWVQADSDNTDPIRKKRTSTDRDHQTAKAAASKKRS